MYFQLDTMLNLKININNSFNLWREWIIQIINLLLLMMILLMVVLSFSIIFLINLHLNLGIELGLSGIWNELAPPEILLWGQRSSAVIKILLLTSILMISSLAAKFSKLLMLFTKMKKFGQLIQDSSSEI